MPVIDRQTPTAETVLPPVDPMKDYHQLQRTLLLLSVSMTGIIFICVWTAYSLNTALNYLIGAFVGIVYLKLLAGDVAQLGLVNRRMGTRGMGLFVILIVVASQWQRMHILPTFLGFLTYKAAIIAYMLKSVLTPESEPRS
ncbi:MAG: ATP synthase subunit I [cyanobacterium endosymbiont of Rhopalodia musculus]|uniref:ATP synthase subunit I n=1 Tax=cyanobacterium endosymbiont of Epithemia clementina EcSB TaxID=3034674 RepID=UPI002480D1DA|nr:ATP synthase subunit I [cyanobacterium endosymbiont of Epithemia clementina EcSB]WGT67908.1 ATP synthase subunit I [cyanobacterium endosymbiont of Epithemia clementina EcSB]